jgi:hypothetical protein
MFSNRHLDIEYALKLVTVMVLEQWAMSCTQFCLPRACLNIHQYIWSSPEGKTDCVFVVSSVLVVRSEWYGSLTVVRGRESHRASEFNVERFGLKKQNFVKAVVQYQFDISNRFRALRWTSSLCWAKIIMDAKCRQSQLYVLYAMRWNS